MAFYIYRQFIHHIFVQKWNLNIAEETENIKQISHQNKEQSEFLFYTKQQKHEDIQKKKQHTERPAMWLLHTCAVLKWYIVQPYYQYNYRYVW